MNWWFIAGLWWGGWFASFLIWMKVSGKRMPLLDAIICFFLIGFAPLVMLFVVSKRKR